MNNEKHKMEQLGYLPFVLSGISFVPFCGVPFGLAAILWGLLTKKQGGKTLAIIGTFGISLTAVIVFGFYYLYSGLAHEDGIFDISNLHNAESGLSELVKEIEFYKVQNEVYPQSLDELAKSQPKDKPLAIYDPTTPRNNNSKLRQYYYELKADGTGYYLLSVGKDGKPFTSDDILPDADFKNTGLLINPSSESNP